MHIESLGLYTAQGQLSINVTYFIIIYINISIYMQIHTHTQTHRVLARNQNYSNEKLIFGVKWLNC